MKRYFSILLMLALAISASVFTSCSSDEDDDALNSKSSLVGRWVMSLDFWDEPENGYDDSDELEIWDFKKDGTLLFYFDGELYQSAKWSLKGTKLTVIYDDEDDDDEAYAYKTYRVQFSGNTLFLYDNDEIEIRFVREGQSPDNNDPEKPSQEASVVGDWEISRVVTKTYTTIPEMQDYYNSEKVTYGNGEYWSFTTKKLTVHDPNDIMNGKAVNYTYDKSRGTLAVSGWMTYNVTVLTSSNMTLEFDSNDGQFGTSQIIEFQKR